MLSRVSKILVAPVIHCKRIAANAKVYDQTLIAGEIALNERFANTPEPPYFAVIFTNKLSSSDEGYAAMGERMYELALAQRGCLGIESTRDVAQFGITVSYWKDEASIAEWKANATHLFAQKMGIDEWYEHYELRVAKIERAYNGPSGRSV